MQTTAIDLAAKIRSDSRADRPLNGAEAGTAVEIILKNE
jgi:hypothetical protein